MKSLATLLIGIGLYCLPQIAQAQDALAKYSFNMADEVTAQVVASAKDQYSIDLTDCTLTDADSRAEFRFSEEQNPRFIYGLEDGTFFVDYDGTKHTTAGPLDYAGFIIPANAQVGYTRINGGNYSARVPVHGQAKLAFVPSESPRPPVPNIGLVITSDGVFFPTNHRGETYITLACEVEQD